jgi:hypothetical protein
MEPYHASSEALITAENNIARFYSQKKINSLFLARLAAFLGFGVFPKARV